MSLPSLIRAWNLKNITTTDFTLNCPDVKRLGLHYRHFGTPLPLLKRFAGDSPTLAGAAESLRSMITLGTIERLAGSTTAENLGVNLQESKQIANRLQDTVVKQQLREHCEQRRKA